MKKLTSRKAVLTQFGGQQGCRKYLEKLRWPDGVQCPRCESDRIARIAQRDRFDCGQCGYGFSLTAGTAFGDSHLPLSKWFFCVCLMCDREGANAKQIERALGVTYKTAWFLCHRIRAAMADMGPDPLKGIVRKIPPTEKQVREQLEMLERKSSIPVQRIAVKHVRAYMGELEFRQINRRSTNMFEKVVRKLIDTPGVKYRELTE
jgi:transposase-like protein